jgi:hypothetical protein
LQSGGSPGRNVLDAVGHRKFACQYRHRHGLTVCALLALGETAGNQSSFGAWRFFDSRVSFSFIRAKFFSHLS